MGCLQVGNNIEISATFIDETGQGNVPTSANAQFTYVAAATNKLTVSNASLSFNPVNNDWEGTWYAGAVAINSTVNWVVSCSGPLVASASGDLCFGSYEVLAPPPPPSTCPTLQGFIYFAQHQMNIPTLALPTESIYLTWAYDLAISIVNKALQRVPGPIYMLAVYNLGGSNLINLVQDQPGQNYFTSLRTTLNINGIVPGVVQTSSDEATSMGLANPDWVKTLTIADLQYYKDPYGRAYLSYAQRYGPGVWGVS